MTRIPGVEQVERVSPRVGRDPGLAVTPETFGAGTGRALQVGSSQVAQLAESTREAFDRQNAAAELGRANADAAVALKELEYSFRDDPDYRTYDERYQAGAEQIFNNISGAITDPNARSAFENSFRRASTVSAFNVRTLGRERQVDIGKAQLERDSDTYAGLYARAETDVEKTRAADAYRIELARAAETGLITQEEAAKRERRFIGKAETADAQRLILGDPELAERALLDPKLFPHIEEGRRVALLARAQSRADAAERRRVAAVEKADRKEAKLIAEQQEITYGRTYDRIVEGRADEQELDALLANREIDGRQFVSLRKALETEAAVEDDPNVVVVLEQDLDDETLTPERILALYSQQSITQATAQRYLTAVRKGTNQVEKEALAFLRDNVGGVRGPLAVLDTQASIREAGAVREYRTRVDDGEDPWKVADDVVQRYRPADPGLRALPRPRYLVGTVSAPDLEKTRQATVEAFRAGQIDRTTLNTEAALIDKIERIIAEQKQYRDNLKNAPSRD